jgi:chromosome segregation ATPase
MDSLLQNTKLLDVLWQLVLIGVGTYAFDFVFNRRRRKAQDFEAEAKAKKTDAEADVTHLDLILRIKKELESEVARARADKLEIQAKYDSISDEYLEMLREDQRQISALEERIGRLEYSGECQASELRALREENERLRQRAIGLTEKLDDAEASIAEMTTQIVELRNALRAAERRINELEQDNARLCSENAELRNRIDSDGGWFIAKNDVGGS